LDKAFILSIQLR